ncbi:MAG: energy transducer TonB [Bacteroidota bacterium]
MRKPEGVAPKTSQDERKRLGASSQTVFEGSLSASLSIIILVFLFFPDVKPAQKIFSRGQEIVTIEEVEHTRQIAKAPPPPRPAIPIEAPSDEILEDVELTSSELDITQEVAPPPPQSSGDEDEQYFVAVEDMPQIIGGTQALARVLVYPEIALRAQVQGRVFVLAFVNEKGEVTKTQLLKGIGGGCDEAALSAVQKIRFTPGRQRGTPVKVKVSVPVIFRIRAAS